MSTPTGNAPALSPDKAAAWYGWIAGSPRASMMGMFLDDAPRAELLAALDALPSADVAARARSKLGLG